MCSHFHIGSRASHVSCHFHLIHGHAHCCLSVLFLLTFYFLLDFTFLLFLLLTMTDRDSMDFNPLCHFANGSFVTLDDCMPDTERGEEIRPRAKRPPRTRSSEAPDADARETERLAHRVEQYSQRMAELLRRGVLEPLLAYAFLMTKGGQRIPQAKSKAKARASSRATTSEGAEVAPDTSPPRLPPERPPMVFTRGETRNPLMLVRRYELRDEPDALSSAGHCCMAPAQG